MKTIAVIDDDLPIGNMLQEVLQCPFVVLLPKGWVAT